MCLLAASDEPLMILRLDVSNAMVPVMSSMAASVTANSVALAAARGAMCADESSDMRTWLMASSELYSRLEEHVLALQMEMSTYGNGFRAMKESGLVLTHPADGEYLEAISETTVHQSRFYAQAASALAMARLHSCGRLAATAKLIASLLAEVMDSKLEVRMMLHNWLLGRQTRAKPMLDLHQNFLEMYNRAMAIRPPLMQAEEAGTA